MVLVSRHATSHANAQQLVAQGKASGCNVHIRDCDLADENSLIECLANCSRTMPPVRGVINAAMVLDVSLLTHPFSCASIELANTVRNTGHCARAHDIRAMASRRAAQD